MKPIATLTFLPSPEGLRAMRLFIKTYADAAGMDFETAGDLCVAAGEAVNNAVEHGAAAEGASLSVVWCEDDDSLCIRIVDQGSATPPDLAERGKPTMEEVEDRERGVGLVLMQALVDEVRTGPAPEGGNEVTLMKRKGAPV